MGKIDASLPSFRLSYTGAEIQRILEAVRALSVTDVKQVIQLLEEIKKINPNDDEDTIGQQLLNMLDSMVSEDEIIKDSLKTSDYPTSSTVVKNAIDAHKNATDLDHPNRSVKTKHIADLAVTNNKIDDGAVTNDKIANSTITGGKIADKSISGSQIADDEITSFHLAANSVETRHIDSKAVTADKIAERAINKSKLSDEIIQNWNGTWKYGTELTHTTGSVKNLTISGAKAGDYYHNSETNSVYYTHNGEDWIYIGNLKGSIDENIWAKLDSPKFTGEPTAPTPAVTNNSKQIATTEFVHNAIKDSEIGGDVSNNGYREISGQVVFNNVPDVKLSTPEILSQSLTITSDANPESVSISATGSVKWKGITYNATATTIFDATANQGSLDESFTNIYIKCNRVAPTQSSIVFSYDAFSVVTDEYIIIPIERVEAKYSMSTGNEGWEIDRHTPIGYDDVPTDALALKSQLDEMMSKFTALENRVKSLENKIPS